MPLNSDHPSKKGRLGVNLRILGTRILVRNYELPEKTAGGLVIPEAYRNMYDGVLFEVVAVSEKALNALCVVGRMEDRVVVGLSEGYAEIGISPDRLDLQPDDIVQLKGASPVYSPEMTAEMGYNCWFVDVVVNQQGRNKSTIEFVWPSKEWKEEAA